MQHVPGRTAFFYFLVRHLAKSKLSGITTTRNIPQKIHILNLRTSIVPSSRINHYLFNTNISHIMAIMIFWNFIFTDTFY